MSLVTIFSIIVAVNLLWGLFNWFRMYGFKKELASPKSSNKSGKLAPLSGDSILNYIKQFKKSFDRMSRELEETKDELGSLENKADETENQDEKKRLADRVEESKQKAQKISQEFERKKEILKALRAEFDLGEMDFSAAPSGDGDDGLSVEMESLKEINDQLTSEKKELREMISHKDDEIEQILSSLEELSNQSEPEAEGSDNGEIEALNSQIADLQREIVELKNQIDEMSDYASLKEKIEDLQKKLDEDTEHLKKLLATKESEVNVLKEEVSHNQDLLKNMGDLDFSAEEANWVKWIQSVLVELDYKGNVQKDPADAKSFLHKNISELKRMAKYEEVYNNLKDEYDALVEAYENALNKGGGAPGQNISVNLGGDADKLKQELDEVNRAYEQLNKDYRALLAKGGEDKTAEIQELKNRKHELEEELVELNTEMVNVMEENLVLKRKLNEMEHSDDSEIAGTAVIGGDTTELETKVHQLEMELEGVTSEYEKLFENSMQQEDVDRALQKLKDENEQLKQTISDIQKDLESKDNELDMLTEEYERLFSQQVESNNQGGDIREVMELNKKLENGIKKMKTDYKSALEKLKIIAKNHEALSTELAKSNTVIAEKDKQIKKLEQRIAAG